MKTQWGPRVRLQVPLDGRKVNVRIHACETCNFIEWAEAGGEKVGEVSLTDTFVAKLGEAVASCSNRCLPELVAEGSEVLKDYQGTTLLPSSK